MFFQRRAFERSDLRAASNDDRRRSGVCAGRTELMPSHKCRKQLQDIRRPVSQPNRFKAADIIMQSNTGNRSDSGIVKLSMVSDPGPTVLAE
jgi:hypothetical protein